MVLRRAGIALAVLLLAGLLFALGPPHVTWLNAGLRIEHPWRQGAFALASAAGAATLAALLRPRWLRAVAGLLAAATAALGVSLLVYRVDVAGEGLTERRLRGTVRLAWADVVSVENRPEVLAVVGPSDRRVQIDVGRLTLADRAALERTISRRVRDIQLRAQAQ
jgi:hypothetical protein